MTTRVFPSAAEIAQRAGAWFHTDAVQAFGYLPVRPIEEGIDMLTVCSHKIYGPKGVGALYIRHGLQVAAEAYGGPQEHRLRAGTENVAAIAGFGKAAELLEAERDDRVRAARRLTDAEKALVFAQTYAALRRRITAFVELPFESLSRMSLQSRVDAIGTDAQAKA